MSLNNREYPKGSRANRFLEIRDAVLALSIPARPVVSGRVELSVGPFLIHYSIPGVLPGRGFNMEIWPAGAQQDGYIIQGNKVANVDWDQSDLIRIISYRSGEWEQQLLSLLAASENVEFLPRRK